MNQLSRALVRGALLAAGLAPTALLVYGCGNSEEQALENFCGWLGDPSNCYRQFSEDIGASCGVQGPGPGPKGRFLERKKLDTCILQDGGIITFDPAPTIASFPVRALGAKISDTLGLSCAEISVDFEDFTLSIFPGPETGATTSNRTGKGGVYTQTAPGGRDTVDVQCPGESHHFNSRQLAQCEKLAPLVPRAEIESAPGTMAAEGYVRLRIYFPPTTGELSGAKPVPVEYFDCAIPKAPPLCADEVRNQDETDTDCGGVCPPCGDGQSCLEDADCESGTCLTESGVGKCKKSDVVLTTAASSTASTSTGGGAGATSTTVTSVTSGGGAAASSASSVTTGQ